MSAADDILVHAVRWWATKRPADWDREAHLALPAVNTTSPAEEDLARAVAAYVENERQ